MCVLREVSLSYTWSLLPPGQAGQERECLWGRRKLVTIVLKGRPPLLTTRLGRDYAGVPSCWAWLHSSPLYLACTKAYFWHESLCLQGPCLSRAKPFPRAMISDIKKLFGIITWKICGISKERFHPVSMKESFNRGICNRKSMNEARKSDRERRKSPVLFFVLPLGGTKRIE